MSVGDDVFMALKNEYPQVIESLPEDTFTSHEFILALAQQHQGLYIEALSAYLATLKPQDSPFRAVHGRLSQLLSDFAEYQGHVQSKDIFRTPNDCAEWKKRPS